MESRLDQDGHLRQGLISNGTYEVKELAISAQRIQDRKKVIKVECLAMG